MLGQQKGITSSKSTYPEGKVTVGFDPHQVSEQAIIAFITDLGFTVQGEQKG
jgi:copper chaperone CopZ